LRPVVKKIGHYEGKGERLTTTQAGLVTAASFRT
jgi:hypothetical protein